MAEKIIVFEGIETQYCGSNPKNKFFHPVCNKRNCTTTKVMKMFANTKKVISLLHCRLKNKIFTKKFEILENI